ncbi:hypothetical protein [Nocardiopsis sp. JB363]|uniref:hypothetical protein n=1 Tax=Nocardiopsis sp. JB363 TaxID=1434837 RepID=UPI00117DA988|nr:hypothetical protein [Nocardiopsis sp. JB363]
MTLQVEKVLWLVGAHLGWLRRWLGRALIDEFSQRPTHRAASDFPSWKDPDPYPGTYAPISTIRMRADRVGLIDWDDSHVGAVDLDLLLPHSAAGLSDDAHEIAAQAFVAWDAARCWGQEFAVEQLAQVRVV